MVRLSKNVVVFDSGIGGLNLLHACAVRNPNLNYFYISDEANVPYGNRAAEEILELTLEALRPAKALCPAALVVACNTVTANCIDFLRQRFPFPVIGVQPAVKQAVEVGGRVLVLATKYTISSEPFKKLIASCNGAEVVVYGCADLAAYVEKNILDLPQSLPDGLLPNIAADSVVLGCTHYIFLKKQIEEKYNCPVFDGTEPTADHFAKILGTADHFPPRGFWVKKKTKIVFCNQINDKNSQIYKKYFKTHVQECELQSKKC